MNARVTHYLVLASALVGLFFASFSTYDFASHLDRQVHEIHCSFIPGLFKPDATASSGCHVAMMSPYSSVFRSSVWGGLPISLPAMAVFAFIAFWSAFVIFTKRLNDKRAMLFLLAATALPLVSSIGMGVISAVKLGTFCKLCIGIYSSSIVGFVTAFISWRRAGEGFVDIESSETVPNDVYVEPLTMGALGGAFGTGVAFVLVPVGVYFAVLPNYEKLIGSCEGLTQPADPGGLFVSLDNHAAGASTIEVLDPLCPSCKAFESRLDVSGYSEQLSRKGVLFPLDATCNWMVSDTMHPGACTVSEAVLCAGDNARAVLDWAFKEQDAIREAAKNDKTAAARMVTAQFPNLASCIGQPNVKQKLNRSLRWAVANHLPVLTPQLYVNSKKLCDEDTDLGMDYALSHLLSANGGH